MKHDEDDDDEDDEEDDPDDEEEEDEHAPLSKSQASMLQTSSHSLFSSFESPQPQ